MRPVITEYGGEAFEIGDELTVFEAALVYTGRSPRGVNLSGKDLETYEIWLGKNARGDDQCAPWRKVSWDIYCELLRRIETKEIVPLKRAYQPNGSLDPRATLIRTADLAKLADDRGESPEHLKHIPPLPVTHTGMPGRPSPKHVMLNEMKARSERGELCETLAAEATALIKWLKANHSHLAPGQQKSFENAIRKEYNRLKSATKP